MGVKIPKIFELPPPSCYSSEKGSYFQCAFLKGDKFLLTCEMRYPPGKDHISHRGEKENHRLKSALVRDMLVPRRVS